jgi:uncharacterized membrane protein (DUF441 family)
MCPVDVAAVVTGVFAAWVAGKGLLLFKALPDAITSLILGSIVGISFFHGIAVAPLIVAGILSVFIGFLKILVLNDRVDESLFG